MPFAEYKVTMQIVERVMQPACTKRIHPRINTRGSREHPWELAAPQCNRHMELISQLADDA